MVTAQPTVLLVDDEKDVVDVYALAFSDHDYTVMKAYGGEEALEKIADADVVLLDRRMPGLSGDEVLARIREQHDDVMVAMLTAVEPGEELVELPLDDYVAKPIDNEELLALVEDLLVRAEYDGPLQEFFALVGKKRALERTDREPTAGYGELTARLQSLRESIEADLDEIGGPADPRERDW